MGAFSLLAQEDVYRESLRTIVSRSPACKLDSLAQQMGHYSFCSAMIGSFRVGKITSRSMRGAVSTSMALSVLFRVVLKAGGVTDCVVRLGCEEASSVDILLSLSLLSDLRAALVRCINDEAAEVKAALACHM